MAKLDILHKPMTQSINTKTALATLWLAVLLIIIDQLTKYWANSVLTEGVPVPIMDHLNMTLVYNHGAAFSFLADMGGWQRWFFTALAVGVSGFLLFWLKRLPNAWTAEVIALNLILSGALGNLIDRVLFGKVTDFVDFYIGTWHYATFNVADIAISVGAFLLILWEFFLKPKPEKELTE
ncbi:signal peptidase II [Thiosulfativibrio zosterae]|nr:signal peptidase II [Thiosulfativibrio zosterae]